MRAQRIVLVVVAVASALACQKIGARPEPDPAPSAGATGGSAPGPRMPGQVPAGGAPAPGATTPDPSPPPTGTLAPGPTTPDPSTPPPGTPAPGAPTPPAPAPPGTPDPPPSGPVVTVPLTRIVPRAVATTETGGVFRLRPDSGIFVEPAAPETMDVGQLLAERLRPATGYALPVAAGPAPAAAGHIQLRLAADAGTGDEGYTLTITDAVVTLSAVRPAGLHFGAQTIRQLLPAAIEQKSAQPGPWALATGSIRDRPRFVWRGAMLDVARWFFGVDVIKRYIDLFSYYKINRLHLHLSDDQGWRIAIDAWPRLTSVGGMTQAGGGAGGFFTKAQYADLVAYAQRRHMMIVPEIDMPGHINAALTAYPELTCNGVAPPPYTGIGVGFSSLCVGTPATDRFVREVLGELAAMTPGPYLHIGGDETMATSAADYARFVSAAEVIVKGLGKQMIGWDEIVKTGSLDPTSVAQHWQDVTLPARAKQRGAKLIMSPATRAYLNMKYDATTRVGADWAGFNDEQDAYEWDPVTVTPGLVESDVLGLEAPLWTLVLRSVADMDYLAFPRLPGHAEVAWSPQAGKSWDEYKTRIASHGPRLQAMGVGFYRSARIPWPPP
jgi:hexosaminidase